MSLAVDESLSPRETVDRGWCWVLRGRAARPAGRTYPVYDSPARLIGVPDLFDPVAGLVGEYSGAVHRSAQRATRKDVAREEGFRSHGLEFVERGRAATAATVVAARIRARSGAGSLACRRSSGPGRWWHRRGPAPVETLDARLERLGLVERLTRL